MEEIILALLVGAITAVSLLLVLGFLQYQADRTSLACIGIGYMIVVGVPW